jgi:hypothetical protein
MLAFVLQDSASALWKVTIDDNGDLHVVSTATGTPLVVNLNDATNAASFQLTVTTLGDLDTISITFNAGYAKTLAINSSTENTSWTIGVLLDGDIKTAFVANISDVVTRTLVYRYAG